MRLALLLVLFVPPGFADETRLGTLIRLYLKEERPSRQFDLIDKISRLVDGDVRRVAAAIRRCEHCRFDARPAFRTGGPPPVFHPRRFRIQPVTAGDYAALTVPEGYDPQKAYPLVVDLGAGDLPVPDGAARVKINVLKHAQAKAEAMAAEALVLSVVARAQSVVHVDPDRILLRAQVGSAAALAWYIALHNPDRFAGLLTLQGYWQGAGRVAPNSLFFDILAVGPRGSDATLKAFFRLDARLSKHTLVPFPREGQKEELLPTLAKWYEERVRAGNPRKIELIVDRPVTTRAYWARVAPRRRSIKRGTVARVWRHESAAIPGTFIAEVDQKDRNLIRVRTFRVSAFHIYVDPSMFDVERPLRVKINDGVPIANLIDHNLRISTLLEDYRERRDTNLLYAASFSFSVRREPSRPPR